ncbi:DNA cross-link repair 1A protein [Drosophila navojoa]|uniref:DNA cross-link repair 1A protein n=1 Tax=Drosophila navojoa TaxID=7232 RepID=UPI0008474464|nr:DNA cross-link repair 1A protein [Drosophila navojoa]
MSTNVGKIRLRNLAELQQIQVEKDETDDVMVVTISSGDENKTPEKPKKAGIKRASSTAKKKSTDETKKVVATNTAIKRTVKKEPLPGQMRIDSFFKSSSKSYKVELSSEHSPIKMKARKGCKRLFDEESTTKGTIPKTSVLSSDIENKRETVKKRTLPQRKSKAKCSTSPAAIIDLCSDESESDQSIRARPIPIDKLKDCQLNPLPIVNIPNLEVQGSNDAGARSKENGPKERKRKRCPSYKIVEDTTFVVDGFQFGDIPNATHYFLSHYHADHYVGLTRKFAHPLYMSPITAKLVRTFIPIDNQYMHEIDVGESITLNEVEITALDANHCPGAIMLMFKFTTGKCILHTGDFRATFEMESLPIFWNEPRIDVLYLDTTYLSKNYDFCLQSDSIDRICTAVRQFHEKNADKRILHVCGSYLIGKEKVWLALVEEFRLRVWTEPHRRKAIDCLDWPELQLSLCDDPLEANLHVINMGKISYPSLDQYFKTFEGHYDMLIGIRPSGWEKNSKPSYGKRISVIGVEYSEHSSYKELERFVRFLKPNKVISTVPVGKDLCVTGTVPTNWYKYEGCGSMLSTSYQPSITTFLETSKRSFPALANTSSDMSVSPLKNESTINTANNEDLFEAKQITEDSANVNVPAAHHLPAKRITSDASSDLLSLI